MDIHKEQLASGWTYALKPSLLEAVIVEAGISLPVTLYQQRKTWAVEAPALSAAFYPHGLMPGEATARVTVTSCAILSRDRQAAQSFCVAVFLPALSDWMRSLEAAPSGSPLRREKQQFSCEGSPLALSKRPLPLLAKGQRRRKRA